MVMRQIARWYMSVYKIKNMLRNTLSAPVKDRKYTLSFAD